MRPFRGLSASRPSRCGASAVPGRPSQGFPTSRSSTGRPSGVFGSPAASTSFPRPRGIPPSGPPGPEGPEPLPQAWAPSQGACREGPLGPKASGAPPGVLRPSSDAIDKVRFTRAYLPGTFRPRGFTPPRRVAPLPTCGPEGPLPLLGFAPRPASPAWRVATPGTLAFRRATRPQALRNTRSAARDSPEYRPGRRARSLFVGRTNLTWRTRLLPGSGWPP